MPCAVRKSAQAYIAEKGSFGYDASLKPPLYLACFFNDLERVLVSARRLRVDQNVLSKTFALYNRASSYQGTLNQSKHELPHAAQLFDGCTVLLAHQLEQILRLFGCWEGVDEGYHIFLR